MTVDKLAYYQLINVYCIISNLTECKMEPQNWVQSKCSKLLLLVYSTLGSYQPNFN